MEKAKKFKEVELTFTKVDFAAGEDWGCSVADGLPMGLYLGETPGGGMCIFAVDEFGGRVGFWIPIGDIIKYNVNNQKIDYATTLFELAQRLTKVESLARDNNVHLNEAEEKAEENAKILTRVFESVDLNLANIHGKIDDLQKCKGNQNSSLTEMGEVVVNIIKATK